MIGGVFVIFIKYFDFERVTIIVLDLTLNFLSLKQGLCDLTASTHAIFKSEMT